jgi:TRAP transporter TAXI family solute receptor
MKKYVAALTVISLAGHALAAPVGIASGAESGTNWPMAEDIKKTCSTPTSPINNVVTPGGQSNIFRVNNDPKVQYGIVPADVAAYQRLEEERNNSKMMDKIWMVFPFFSTEFHLIAKDGSPINSIADLAGKTVVEGPEGSATWVTVQMIKRLTKISWNGVKASQTDGYKMVLAGQADAEFIVAGKPITLLETAKGIKLVSISHPGLDSFPMYEKTSLPVDGMYPFQKAAASTYKVDNMLVTYAFKNQYQEEIAELVGCIAKNIGKLQATGHPKWRDVNPLDITRIKWEAHPAALNAIKRNTPKTR